MEKGSVRVTITGKGKVGECTGDGWGAKGAGKGLVAALGTFSAEAVYEGLIVPPLTTKEAIFTLVATKNAERLFPRASRELNLLGITFIGAEAVGKGEEAQEEYTFAYEGIVEDVVNVARLLSAVMVRGDRKLGHTEHPLTWFDLKQAAGLIHLAKEGDAVAAEVIGWGNDILGTIKDAAKADAKAKREAMMAAKKVETKAKAEAKAKAEGAAKAKAEAKAELAPNAAEVDEVPEDEDRGTSE